MSVGRIAWRILTAAEPGGGAGLSDWAAESGIEPAAAGEGGEVSVVIDQSDPHRSKLWDLSDYSVSAVSGIVVWLAPKARPGSDDGWGEAIDPVGSPAHQNQTLKHILDLAEENMKGQDGYEMIAEWARKAIG